MDFGATWPHLKKINPLSNLIKTTFKARNTSLPHFFRSFFDAFCQALGSDILINQQALFERSELVRLLFPRVRFI